MANSNKRILMLPGDGIGPEVFREVHRVIGYFDKYQNVGFSLDEELVGGASYDAHGTPITEKVMEKALNSDAVLLGAVGGPLYDNLEFSKKPERALLRLRKDMDLFANLRPAVVFEALAESSTLKKEIVSDLNLMIVRELTGGIYFGEPRGIEVLSNGEKRGINTEVYTSSEIIRVTEIAFELALKRKKSLHSVEKANVMESGVLWRETVSELHKSKYKNCQLEHMYADNCAMQLIRNPKQFDVIVTGNLFGDILSDISAQLTGSLGMLPSASLGKKDKTDGFQRSLYEPVHGSAPDIAGTGKANPIAMILSYAMMLRYSLDFSEQATIIENAVRDVLNAGYRTFDIAQPDTTVVSTEEMGKRICDELKIR